MALELVNLQPAAADMLNPVSACFAALGWAANNLGDR
jgi:hypothetical protein